MYAHDACPSQRVQGNEGNFFIKINAFWCVTACCQGEGCVFFFLFVSNLISDLMNKNKKNTQKNRKKAKLIIAKPFVTKKAPPPPTAPNSFEIPFYQQLLDSIWYSGVHPSGLQ